LKTKITNVFFAQKAMEEIRALADLDLPIRESVKVIKLMKELTKHHQIFDEARIKLLQKYGTLNQKESRYDFESDDKRRAFNQEFIDLQDIELEVEHEMIEIPEDAKLKPSLLLMFENFVKVKEAPKI